MYNLYRLKKRLRKIKELKHHEIRSQDFEAAASYREQEKQLLSDIAVAQEKLKPGALFRKLFFGHHTEIIHGVYIQEKETDLPLSIPGYHFSLKLNLYLNCFFAENEAFRHTWNEYEFNRNNLTREATEYYLLTEILDYLACRNGHRKKCIHKLTEIDAYEAIQSNLVLKIFTRPADQRKAFAGYAGAPEQNRWIIRDDSGNPKAFYHRFEYTFPYKVSIKKAGNAFVILTPFMILKFRVTEGNTEQLPKDFCRLVLNFNLDKSNRIDVIMDIFQKRPAFVAPKYWKFIRIIIPLKKRLKESFSSEHYFNKLNWPDIYLQSKIIENMISIKRKSTY